MPTIDAEPVRVIIPCLDEEPAIGQLVAALRQHLDARDRVIVVDNGSRDRTAEVALAAGAEVVAEPRRGYGRACLAGLRAAGLIRRRHTTWRSTDSISVHLLRAVV